MHGCNEVDCGKLISEVRHEEHGKGYVEGKHRLYAMCHAERGSDPLTRHSRAVARSAQDA
jgi:hypothetical protein